MTTATAPATPPKISCMMPTYGRPDLVHESVRMFLRQDDPNKELIVLNDCSGQTFEFDHPEVRVVNAPDRFPTLGDKRNRCVELAEGELIAVWDDDDVYLPWRLSLCRAAMAGTGGAGGDAPFYRPAEFWGYWGENWLHDNQSVPGWCSHPVTAFTRDLWKSAGGYPPADVGEDDGFFGRVHELLGEPYVTQPIARDDRFLILRGRSPYAHTSIHGGAAPPDLRPGHIQIEPKPVADPLLRSHYRDRVARRRPAAAAGRDHAVVARGGGPGGRPALSVCVGLKNRSRVPDGGEELTLFPNCVRSLARAAAELDAEDGVGPVELIVADFGSDDWPPGEWLPDAAAGLAWTLLRVDGPFCRGRGRNRAAGHAAGEVLFLCDADLLLDRGVLHRAYEVARGGGTWSGVFQYLNRHGRRGGWEDRGHGPLAAPREAYFAAGGCPEFESWGGEDDLLYERLGRVAPAVRERAGGLRHQWHPDALRHAHSRRPARSHHREFLAARRGAAADPREGTTYYAAGPGRSGELILFENGRCLRPGADPGGEVGGGGGAAPEAGTYTLVPDTALVLDWDDRPRDVLRWDAGREIYEDPGAEFTVRRQDPRPRRVW